MHRGFAFRLYPTTAQAQAMGRWVSVTRFIYNLALEQRRDFWRQFLATSGRHLSWVQQSKELTELRREYNFVADVPRVCLEQALRDLDKAFGAFFAGRTGYPSWRKRGENDRIRFQARDTRLRQLNAKWDAVRLPGIGWVKFRRSRSITGAALNVTISRSGDDWSISLACDVGVAPPLALVGDAVGIDRGAANTLALSNGEMISVPSSATLERRRRKAQRVLSRRRRGSQRYMKQKRRVARLSSKIGRSRTHHLHVASSQIARRFSLVALEDLNVKALTASAKGTVDEPGRNVRQKSGLNRSILAQGWSRFATMLGYKLEAAGGRLVFVPAAYSSQTCSVCGTIDARSRKSQAVFHCVSCGHRSHADTNAAIEIQRRSTALLLAEEGKFIRSDEARTLAA